MENYFSGLVTRKMVFRGSPHGRWFLEVCHTENLFWGEFILVGHSNKRIGSIGRTNLKIFTKTVKTKNDVFSLIFPI